MFWHIFDIYVQTHIQYAWSFRWKRSLIHFGDISGFLVCPSSTYFPVFHREINGPSTRCQKKLLSFAATSNFHSVQKSNRVLKRKRLVTRSGKTDEKYGLWWKTNRCMFYCHEKCRKSRCGIPYNIVLNILKSIFSQRNLMVLVFSFFFLFFLSSYSCHSDCNFGKLLRDQDNRAYGDFIFIWRAKNPIPRPMFKPESLFRGKKK